MRVESEGEYQPELSRVGPRGSNDGQNIPSFDDVYLVIL